MKNFPVRFDLVATAAMVLLVSASRVCGADGVASVFPPNRMAQAQPELWNSTIAAVEARGIRIVLPLGAKAHTPSALSALTIGQVAQDLGCAPRFFNGLLLFVRQNKLSAEELSKKFPKDDLDPGDERLDPFLDFLQRARPEITAALAGHETFPFRDLRPAEQKQIERAIYEKELLAGPLSAKASQDQVNLVRKQDDGVLKVVCNPVIYCYAADKYTGALAHSREDRALKWYRTKKKQPRISTGWDVRPIGLFAKDPPDFRAALRPSVSLPGTIGWLSEVLRGATLNKPIPIPKLMDENVYLTRGDYDAGGLADAMKIVVGLEFRKAGAAYTGIRNTDVQSMEMSVVARHDAEAATFRRKTKLRKILHGAAFTAKAGSFGPDRFLSQEVVSYSDLNAAEQQWATSLLGVDAGDLSKLKFRFMIHLNFGVASQAGHVPGGAMTHMMNDLNPTADLVRPADQTDGLPEYNPAHFAGKILEDDGITLVVPVK